MNKFRNVAITGALLFLFVCFGGNKAEGATFGNPTWVGKSDDVTGNYCRALSAVAYTLSPSANIVIDSIVFGGRSTGATSISMAIYRWRNNLPTDSLIAVTISIPGVIGDSWLAGACSLSVSAGDTICIVEGSCTNPDNIRVFRLDLPGNNQAYTSSGTLANPWVNSGYSAKLLCAYAVYHVVGSVTPTAYTAIRRVSKR